MVVMSSRRILALLGVLCMLIPLFTGSIGMNSQDDSSEGLEPGDIWSEEYATEYFPWGGNDRIQFKEYHDYFTMRDRMLQLAEQNPNIMSFHEGLNGGENIRGQETTAETYEGWHYKHSSPWMKITGGGEALAGVDGGECNDFVGDCGNYADIPDIQLVGNHHAREWMSYEVPMFFLETIAHYYGTAGIDNDGDGLYDEDGWDGIDNDGDCLSLIASIQDSNGDGIACGPGDLGVDEDFSEQLITDLVNTREIYLIPMLNVDGNRYDREEFCGEDGWNCDGPGWRKNLRCNRYLECETPLPDVDPEVDEGCDGVDLNRNYQFEWGAPLGATGPLFPGFCYADGPNNDVYNGPPNENDDDGDCPEKGYVAALCINEDHVDGRDNDGDLEMDEDWWGGNTEPETRFIQDITEMNDDNGDGSSDFKATLTWHAYSNLVLYPWGHCTNCETTDHDQLVFHGNVMAEMTSYENMQSSDLYPTTGDYCDWQYGVHESYCYTIEIGGNQDGFHPTPDRIDHIAVRNLGVPFHMIQIADDPRERANIGIQQSEQSQWIISAENLTIPESGPIPITMCIDPSFPYTNDANYSHVMWRTVKPTRQQSDFGAKEWVEEEWQMTGFQETGVNCTLSNNETGDLIVSNLPVSEEFSGKVHYKSMLGTRSGTFPFSYPNPEVYPGYEEVNVAYRAPFGSSALAFLLFCIVAGTVWGSLGVAIKKMNESEANEKSIVGALD